jgi:hypothetical protein
MCVCMYIFSVEAKITQSAYWLSYRLGDQTVWVWLLAGADILLLLLFKLQIGFYPVEVILQ